MLCASLLLLGWSFYSIYYRGNRTRLTVIVTWLALAFIVTFWTVHLTVGVW